MTVVVLMFKPVGDVGVESKKDRGKISNFKDLARVSIYSNSIHE